MKKLFTVLFLSVLFLTTACGSQPSDNAELAKIPPEFPTHNAPICSIAEFISYTDKTTAGQYSAELVYNSNLEYSEIVDFYKKEFPNAVCTDFGIAYNLVNVMPLGEGHLVSVRIFSSLNSGEKGLCTVTISALEQ